MLIIIFGSMIRCNYVPNNQLSPITTKNSSLPTSLNISIESLAILIIREDGFIDTNRTEGSILATEGHYWRYKNNLLVEIKKSDYDLAINSNDRKDWPPYTITFIYIHQYADQPDRIYVTTYYDMGISENSRGGNESIWTISSTEGEWRVINIAYTKHWD
jgi:hypothetical protein